MYIWKTGELVSELSEGGMSQWEMTKYLIATTVVWYIFGGVYYDPSDIEISEWIVSLIVTAIAVTGIYYCFTVNRKYGNKDFIVRFTILSWPTTIRWILIAVAVYILMAILFRGYLKTSTDSLWFETLYEATLEVIYFWMLSNYIKMTGIHVKEI